MTTTHNFDLTRTEGTRDRQPIRIIEFDLTAIKQHFDENIENINSHFPLSDQLIANDNIEAAKDIWRLQILFLESALDFYIHEVTKYGMNKIFNNEWAQTTQFKNYSLQIPIVIHAMKNPEDASWFFENVNQVYASVTFMGFVPIKTQMNLIGIKHQDIADAAFYLQGNDEKTIDKLKQVLDDLFRRRNAIAHQSDRYHHDASRKDIEKDYVLESIVNIEKIVAAIDTCILEKNAIS